ncbi:MAG: tetratricopeptide repeat protein [Methylococcaceae bacterium]|nr:tetratricopeptide repeat protein [Methylococcaceae bacterium]
MPKLYPKQRWVPPSAKQTKMPKASLLGVFAEKIALIRKIIFDLGFIILIVIFILMLVSEIRRDEIILDPIEIPEIINKSGYTSREVAEKLLDSAQRIGFEAKEKSKNYSWNREINQLGELGAESQIPDIQIPVAGFTLQKLTRFLKSELNIKTIYLSGEIIQTVNGYNLTLRNNAEKDVPTIEISSNGSVEQLLKLSGGEALLKISKPIIPTIQTYHQFEKGQTPYKLDTTYRKLSDLIDYCLKHPPANDDKVAYVLQGKLFNDLNRNDEAILQYQKALDLDPQYTIAYIGWAASLYSLAQFNEAFTKLQKATEIDPYDSTVYFNWCGMLNQRERYDEAIIKCKKAIELEPNSAVAYVNLGNALDELKQYNEALAQYKKASELSTDSQDSNFIYYNWGITLKKLGRYDDAEKLFKLVKDSKTEPQKP